MRKLLSYIFYGVSLAGRAVADVASSHYSCPDNAIGLVGRQLEAVWRNFSYYYQCLCRSHVVHKPHKLNIDSNRNTKNTEIIKIAVENANLCGKKFAICALC